MLKTLNGKAFNYKNQNQTQINKLPETATDTCLLNFYKLIQ